VDERHDVVIVGGGIMGATTLYEFARRGVDAILLERDPDLGGRDSSKTAGIMRTHYSNPAVVRMAIRGRDAFRAIADEAGMPPVLHDIGYAFLASPATLEKARDNVAMQREQGAEVEELPGSALTRFAPGAGTDGISAVFYEQGSGYVAPVPAALAFIAAARSRGATAVAGTPVRRLVVDHGAVQGVETADGRIGAEQVVLAAGAWSQGLAAEVGVDLPITYSIEQELLLSVPWDRAPTASISNAVDAIYERPEFERDAGPGRTAVLVGTGFPKSYPTGDPDAYPDQDAIPALVDELRGRLAIRQPALAEAALLEAKLGLYDITPDWHPILGRVPSVDGLLLITGGSGHGFKIAPAMADLVAADACGETVDYADIAMFSLERFAAAESTFASAYGGNRA
jgi:glycine/D-amino acid oxidase-like deaminating enzyme